MGVLYFYEFLQRFFDKISSILKKNRRHCLKEPLYNQTCVLFLVFLFCELLMNANPNNLQELEFALTLFLMSPIEKEIGVKL